MKKIVTMFLVTVLTMSMSIAKEYNFVYIKGLTDQAIAVLVMKEVYKSMGLTLNAEAMPGKRAQKLATSGEKDGEIMRIFNYGVENPTTLRVPTAFMAVESMAYVKKGSGIKLATKDDLKKHKVVKIRGVKHTAALTKGLTGVLEVDSHEQLFGMLQKGRAEVALTDALAGGINLNKLGITDVVPMDKPLAKLDLFHYPHEKHKDLVPKVDAELKKLMGNGEFEKIMKKAKDEATK